MTCSASDLNGSAARRRLFMPELRGCDPALTPGARLARRNGKKGPTDHKRGGRPMTEEFWPGISIGNMNVSQIQEVQEGLEDEGPATGLRGFCGSVAFQRNVNVKLAADRSASLPPTAPR